MSELRALVVFIIIVLIGFIIFNSTTVNSAPRCNVTGLNPKSHPTLKKGLCALSKALGPVRVTNTRRHKNCRTRNSVIGKRNSWHKYHRGCRAADIRVKGVSPHRVKRWWLRYTKRQKSVLGGAHVYRSGFIHVDTRTSGARTW